ncbi:MAG: PrsW family glutamic-type intramembrane protease [Rhizomicrobium sp.]
MATQFLIEAPIALVPVLVFLVTLHLFDSYRLTSLAEMAETMITGAVLAAAAYFANGYLLGALGIDYAVYSHVVGPAVEEALKAAALVVFFARNRIGFMIDALIMGFAVGTGFGVFENLYYLYAFQDAGLGDWIIRGFGTAILHGGATAIFAVLSQSLIEKRGALRPWHFVPGLAIAIAAHVAYNLLQDTPLIAALAILVGLPPLFYLVFTKSEHAVHQWLVHDYASHEQLLADIESGRFLHTEAGRFILSLTRKFSKAVVEDIFAYLKLHTQLVLLAEKLSLAREKGESLAPVPGVRDDLKRLKELERRIGRSAMMALWPHLHFSRRELWELHEMHGL